MFVLVSFVTTIILEKQIMSARRKHVRAHARDVEVEVDRENDRVCRVEEIKGGNVIEVNTQRDSIYMYLNVNAFSSSGL